MVARSQKKGGVPSNQGAAHSKSNLGSGQSFVEATKTMEVLGGFFVR